MYSISLSKKRRNLRYGGPGPRRKNFAASRRLKWGGNLLFWGLAGFLGLLLINFVWGNVYDYLCCSNFFRITNIRIQGNRQVTRSQILELSNVDFHSNLLAMQPELVEKSLLIHPWIERIRITQSWPNKLIIDIKENIPAAMLNQADGLYYVNKQGRIFAGIPKGGNLDFPVITGLTDDNEKNTAQLKDILAFLKKAQGNTFLPKQNISEIHLNQDNSVILYLLDRTFPIYLGKEDIKAKYTKLTKVLKKLYQNNKFETTAYIRMDYRKDKVLVGSI